MKRKHKRAPKAELPPPTPQVLKPAPRQQLLAWLMYAAVLCAVAAAHWPVLKSDAVIFDDGLYLFANPVLMQPSWSSAWQVLSEVLHSSTVEGYYEPLTLHTLMLDVLQGGSRENLLPFRRTSLILHAGNTLLLMLLLTALFRRPAIGALVALLFGAHPLAVEPLAWIWERKTLLATMFVLLSLLAYVHHARTRKRWAYACAVITFVLALMSKPTVTPLPVMLVLMDFWPLRRLNRAALLEKVPFFAIALVFGIITIISTANTGLVAVETRPSVVLKTIYLLGFYIEKILWPVGLSSAYALPKALTLANPAVLLKVAIALAAAALIVLSLRWTRSGVVAGLWLLIGLLPTLGVVNYSWVVASDKYLYFPSIGLLIALAFLLTWAWDRIERSKGRAFACGIIVLICAAPALLEIRQTRRYLSAWRDTVTICQHMLTVSPDVANVHTVLGDEYARLGRMPEALESFRNALKLDPHSAPANIAYALLLGQAGHLDAAIAHLEHLELQGTAAAYAQAHYALGRLKASKGQAQESIPLFLKAIDAQPYGTDARLGLGLVYFGLGRFDEAREQFEIIVQLQPAQTEAMLHLGLIAVKQRRLQEAVDWFRAVLAKQPAEARAHFQLGLIAQTSGDAEAATRHYRLAVQANPSSSARNNLAWLLATHPDPKYRNGAEAVALAEAARTQLGDDNVVVLDTLAAAYAEVGEFSRAAEIAEKALALAKKGPAAVPAQEIEQRLALYRSQHAYRDTPSPASPASDLAR